MTKTLDDLFKIEALVSQMNKRLTAQKIDMEAHMDQAQSEESWTTGHKQWSSDDQRRFFPVSDTYEVLPPDVYEPCLANGQPYFYRMNFSTEDLITFDDSSIDKVITEINKFWKSKEKFEQFGFPYKRGMLLYGPPGSGKSCAIKLIIKQIIQQKGIGVRFEHPNVFISCMRVLRLIQPNVPVVAIMEDIDAILEQFSESPILNMLDGIDGFSNIVYLATTNYPEELESRISNRPSRFDRRFHIGFPNERSRKIYLEHLQSKVNNDQAKIENIDKWVKDTNNFTFAHMKELFISVKLFETDYQEALEDIIKMREKISSEDDQYHGGIGFN